MRKLHASIVCSFVFFVSILKKLHHCTAFREGASALNNHSTKLFVGQLEPGSSAHSHSATAAAIRSSQPDLQSLPALLRTLLDFEAGQREELVLRVSEHEALFIAQAGVLCASVPYTADRMLQPIHASESFYGGPWYDCVAVNGGQGKEWYAQLRCLFFFRGEQYALVRWFDEARPRAGDVLAKHGCTPLVWHVRDGQPSYDVVELVSVKRRVYVVPDFSQRREGVFHVSPFKWDRLPPLNKAPGSGQGESS